MENLFSKGFYIEIEFYKDFVMYFIKMENVFINSVNINIFVFSVEKYI